MPWNTPPTFTAGQVVTASDLNSFVRDNPNYLLAGRPGSAIKRDNNSNYSSTSTSFVAIDGTNLAITITLNGTKARVSFVGVFNPSGTASAQAAFDVDIDGTRVGSAGADGLIVTQGGSPVIVGFSLTVTGLSVAAHTFKIVWKAQAAGTVVLASGNGTAGQDFIPIFCVEEVG